MKTFNVLIITIFFLLLFPSMGITSKPDFDLVLISSITKKNIKEPFEGVSDSGSFMVVLAQVPVYDVIITISSSDLGEAKVSPSSLHFTSQNYSVPQTVTITGVADYVVDGNQIVKIPISVTSCDIFYDSIDINPIDVVVENEDTRVVTQGTISIVDGSPPDSGSGGGGCLISP